MKKFKENASDVIAKHGFQIATGIYIAANGLMLAQNGINPGEADTFKNVIAPVLYITANVTGLANKPRTTNTLGFFGTLATAVSFAGAGQHGFQLLPLLVATAAATGQCIASYVPQAFKWTKAQLTGGKVTPMSENKTSAKGKFLRNIWDSDFVKGGAIQAGVGLLVTLGAFAAGVKDMIPSALGWNAGDGVKTAWAVKNARRQIERQKPKAAA